MRDIQIEKVVVNIGVGESGQKLENAKELLQRITGRKGIATRARVRNPTFKIKRGESIGAKVTLRGQYAVQFLKKAFDAIDFNLNRSSFDMNGNFSFGVKEYIDFPGIKYEPSIGMLGFDVCVTLKRPGWRVEKRKRARAKCSKKHRISKEEGIEFIKKAFNLKIKED